MNYNDYEELVSGLAKTIFESVPGHLETVPKYGRKNKHRGASGYCHQIDVSVFDGTNLLLVECKCLNKNVEVEKVLAFYGRIADIQPTCKGRLNGVMVTTIGFQRGAKTVAEHFGIQLWWVKSANEFGMKYRDYINIGACDSVAVNESVSVKIVESSSF